MTSRLSILVEKPKNAFKLSDAKIEKLKSLSKKQIDDMFKEAEQSLENSNDYKRRPVSRKILDKPFEIVK